MIVEVLNKPQLECKIGGEAQGYSYVKENRTRTFLLELFASQIRLLLTYGASQTGLLRCEKPSTVFIRAFKNSC